eukprot:CAMPEP_0177784458 /NCGR_PEP_ID=MMETSP0491_2-20121128/19720_1 /TAXON_ID=63592 /ORGANISM="Tetraselmis chuii, Strain PLY429" /LENGTH=172 /DNA_ID=CAMNT_0019305243 /DNA_START=111 /DNA_END=630 /DNA_ORIENTATION=-
MPVKTRSYAAMAGVAALGAAGAAAVWAYFSTKPGVFKLNRKLRGCALKPEELAAHDGADSSKPTLLAIRNQIYDVSSRPDMYGPAGSYPFAGKEIARALAKMSVRPEDCTSDLSGLTEEELEVLADWEAKFTKYQLWGMSWFRDAAKNYKSTTLLLRMLRIVHVKVAAISET